MKKRIAIALLTLLLVAVLAASFGGCEKNKTEDDVITGANDAGLAYYLQDDGTYAVGAGYGKLLSKISISEKHLGKKVTAVIASGFADCPNLTEISLPKSVTVIGEEAFRGSSNLKTIKLGGEALALFTLNETYTSPVEGVEVGARAFVGTALPSLTIADSADGDTLVSCSFRNAPEGASVKITAALNETTDVRTTTTRQLSANASFDADFGTYGIFRDIDVTLALKGGKNLVIENAAGVTVTAPEYNFALLNASYPVLVFSLKIDDVTKGGTVPTFVFLERDAQYDWSNLPAGVQHLPYLTLAQATSEGGFHAVRPGMAAYIKELYESDPNAKFRFFAADNYGELVLEMLVANGIPESNWSATLLSDGTGTAALLSDTFAVDHPEERYDLMRAEWEDVKAHTLATGSFDAEYIDAHLSLSEGGAQRLQRYAYVIVREQPNVEWWVNRFRAGENLVAINEKEGGAEFIATLRGNAKEFYTNSLLAALTPEGQEAFKKLYKFNSDMFGVAEETGKKPVVILGTSWAGEEEGLYDYIRLLVEFYGTEDYVYYYKGHPGYATSQYEGRQAYFAALAEAGYDILELDNALAAEIILFFNPDVYLAGYPSTTFESLSAEGADKAMVLFTSKEIAYGASYAALYAPYFDLFVSKLDASAQKDYAGVAFEKEHTYYLVEYNNTEDQEDQIADYEKHEIAVYDVEEETVRYYKRTAGRYVEVDRAGETV